ncbi:MAG: hypothetical protein KC912_07855 [Proteobacteria bacterium]|nr:hypothetical protein [Pseudomonadota bacterium]
MSEMPAAPALSEAVEESKKQMLLRYAKHGAALTAMGTGRVISRTLWWGWWGGVLGATVFTGLWMLGLLTFPWPDYQTPITVVLAVLYVGGGVAAWGYAGMWRGAGRFVIALGVDNGWVVSLLSAIFDKMVGMLRASQRVDAAMDKSEVWLGDLPLERWEALLSSAVAAVLGETTEGSTRIMRWIRRFVLKQIQRLLLTIVRKEIADGHGGGVSMARVREVGFERAAKEFKKAIQGLMNKQLLLMTAIYLGIGTLIPILAWAIPQFTTAA